MKKHIIKTIKKKEEGNSIIQHIPCLLFLVTIVALCVMFGVRIRVAKTVKYNMQDAIVASNLASLVIDVDNIVDTGHYYRNGIISYQNGELAVLSQQNSFEQYCKAIKMNLDLNDDYSSPNTRLFDNFSINKYIVYEVKYERNAAGKVVSGQKYVLVTVYNQRSMIAQYRGVYGQETTPNGVVVRNTCAYSKLEFTVKDMRNNDIQCKCENVTDYRKTY